MRHLRALMEGAQSLTIDPSPRLRDLRMKLEAQEAIRRAQWSRHYRDSTQSSSSH